MNRRINRSILFVFLSISATQCCHAESNSIFLESDGLVAVEAEHFFSQTRTAARQFYVTTPKTLSTIGEIKPDGDPPHLDGSSGNAYLEILPDTRRTHADKLIHGENFMPNAGKMAILSYRVRFRNPGRYYVWARAYSTGGEDNGLHVGLDGKWPESGQRLQWCDGKNQWWWESRQRTEKEHCGEPHKIYLDIESAGDHIISFSMREDGFEFDKWLMTTSRDFERPADAGPAPVVDESNVAFNLPLQETTVAQVAGQASASHASQAGPPLVMPRGKDGDGNVAISGELKQWHTVTLTVDGPFANELDNKPNPFTDYRMDVTFEDARGKSYVVPGYFAADGNAANTSASSGTKWRAHFAPYSVGTLSYAVSFRTGDGIALDRKSSGQPVAGIDGASGAITIAPSDKSPEDRDFRGHGWLEYVGGHHLQFAGSKKYFLKAGADAPETLLAYVDFDNTETRKPKMGPLKTWQPHVQDWREGDPTWKDGKGKGLIGAINYLSGKGCNAFSFLTYNAGGDGDNVWPFVSRDDKRHYDCSKLDQWGIVFEHGTRKGMYLHFKMQETEIDDNQRNHKEWDGKSLVRECLDGGELGPDRRLYFRELIARYGHNLALNWNMGEENTQSEKAQRESFEYIASLDPYQNNRVMHTYPHQQEKHYDRFLGDPIGMTGLSLQNDGIRSTHGQAVKWIAKSQKAGKPWVVAFDESGTAGHGQCPDLGYRGFDGHDNDGKMAHTEHEVRHFTLWGTLMAGGAGVEYYFGYKFVENDLKCEDWRSRDRSWDYCRIAIEFFHDNEIPFWEMRNRDELVGNPKHDNSVYCLAKDSECYLIYLPASGGKGENASNGNENGVDFGRPRINFANAAGDYSVHWFNPRVGGELVKGTVASVTGGVASLDFGEPASDADKDWLVVIRKLQ